MPSTHDVTIDRDVAGIVLAAGRSSRMGAARNKLVEEVAGRPIVVRAVDAFLEAGIEPVIVVLGHEADRVHAVLADRPVRFVRHASWSEGMGSSLARGIAELVRSGAGPAAVLVCVGDLPGIRADNVREIVRGGRDAAGRIDPARIVVPTRRGQRGHPVLFGAHYLRALAELTGDEGGRQVVRDNASRVHPIEIDDDACFRDVDTVDDLTTIRARENG